MENKNYFTHDYRSRLDTKLLEVRMKHGMEGFGVYWGLVEMLHEGNGTIQMKPDVIAYEFRCNVELVKDIVNICFERTEDDLITCNRVMENLRIRKEKFESKSEKGRDAANKRTFKQIKFALQWSIWFPFCHSCESALHEILSNMNQVIDFS